MWLAPLVALLACSTEKQDCPPAQMCVAAWDAQKKVCPAEGHCEPRPAPVELELALPIPAGDRIICGKGNLEPSTSHSACTPPTRFAFDLISSAFEAPHLIVAAADGAVVARGGCASTDLNHQSHEDPCNDGWGNYVRVQHDAATYTQYAHLSAILVHDGDRVRRGQPIGLEGNTGLAGAKHLHFSAHRGDAHAGGPSVPMARLRLQGRTVASDALVCGDWSHGGAIADAMRLDSETAVARPPEQFGFVAIAEPVALPERRCGAGFEAAGDGVCFARPSGRARGIVLFLHGMYGAAGAAEEARVEESLARDAAARGLALVAPRGRAGLCAWSADVKDKACWPSGRSQDAVSVELARALDGALDEAARRLGGGRLPRYLLGFSNGGFFAAHLLAEARLPLDGAAILHGGIVEPASFAGRAVPILLLAADGDPWQGPKMKRLDERLTAAGWPHRFEHRAGEHALTPADARAALDFFAGGASTLH